MTQRVRRHASHVLLVIATSLAIAPTTRAQEADLEPATRRVAGQTAASRLPPTHADVKYGPHERNVMDVWLAKSDAPTPVLIVIHGGGFVAGDKSSINFKLLEDALASGISVVAISYRYSTQAIAPAPLLDGARAVQFVRSRAGDWKLDATRVACMGNSAGAAMSLWIALHDDLADAASADPVARQSTRLTCAVGTNGQVSYNPRFIRKIFPEFDVTQHPAVAALVGVPKGTDLQSLSPQQHAAYEQAAAITHASADDPPILMSYGAALDAPVTTYGIGIHHPRFGVPLKAKLDALKVPCILKAKGDAGPTPIEFIRQQFGVK